MTKVCCFVHAYPITDIIATISKDLLKCHKFVHMGLLTKRKKDVHKTIDEIPYSVGIGISYFTTFIFKMT